jgi:hypothetical protein
MPLPEKSVDTARLLARGLLCGFFERDVEKRVDLLRGQVGRIDIAQAAEQRQRFCGGEEGGVHFRKGQAIFSHDGPHNGMVVQRL